MSTKGPLARQADSSAEAAPEPIAVPFKRPSLAQRLRRSLPTLVLAAVFVGVVAIGASRIVGGGIGGLFTAPQPDQMTLAERDDIARRFYAHGPIALEAVKLRDLDKAIASMALTRDQEAALRSELATIVVRDHPADGQRLADAISPPKPPVPAATSRHPTPASPAPQAPAVDPETRLPLVWLTLWDYRDEDGDVVRVVSSGYSRIVPIWHKPVTLAIPAPPNGVVNLIGAHDGFGGITVGISSGAVPVALPVLSEGQIVGVPVTVR